MGGGFDSLKFTKIWDISLSERISACHVEETSSTLVCPAIFLVWADSANGKMLGLHPGVQGSSPCRSTICPVRQAVKSSPFQGEVMGSNPIQDTKFIFMRWSPNW